MEQSTLKHAEHICYQWGQIALFDLLVEVKVTRETAHEYLVDAMTLIDAADLGGQIDLPKHLWSLTKEDVNSYRVVLELLLQRTIQENSENDIYFVITSNLIKALKAAVLVASKLATPSKSIKRERSPVKSGIQVPKEFFARALSGYLAFIETMINKVSSEKILEFPEDYFDFMMDLLLRRRTLTGCEGSILSILSVNTENAKKIWQTIVTIAKLKETPKLKAQLETIVNSIKVIRFTTEQAVEHLKDIASTMALLKGKWSQPCLFPIMSMTFEYFYNANDATTSNPGVAEALSIYGQCNVAYTLTSGVVDSYKTMVPVLKYINDNEFIPLAQKMLSSLVKNYSKIGGSNFFQLMASMVEAAAIHPRTHSENLLSIIKGVLFTNEKKYELNCQFKDDVMTITNMFAAFAVSLYEEIENMIVEMLEMNPRGTSLELALLMTQAVSRDRKGSHEKFVKVLIPIVKSLTEVQQMEAHDLELIIPLLSLIWETDTSFRTDITSIMIRLSKTKGYGVISHAATFFSDIMKNYPVGSMPGKVLGAFCGQYLRRVEDGEGDLKNLVKSWGLYRSFFKNLVEYAQRSPDAIDQSSWQQIVGLCENRLLIFAHHPAKNIRDVTESIWELLGQESVSKLGASEPLAMKQKILRTDLSELAKSFLCESFAPRYTSVATFFTKPCPDRDRRWQKDLAKFLMVTYRQEFFENGVEDLKDNFMKEVCICLNDMTKKEIFEIVSVMTPEASKAVIRALVENKVNLAGKIHFIWSFSSHRKFAEQVRNDADLSAFLITILSEYVASNIPTNEAEQETEISGAEFSATFIRARCAFIMSTPEFSDVADLIRRIIARLNPDSITLPDVSHVFSLLEVVHAIVDSTTIDESIMEDLLDWTLYIALKTKGSSLLQLKCHKLVVSLVMHNPDCVGLIIQCCSRTSPLTTAHVSSAIIAAGVSTTDLATLALGLSGRPSLICKAMAAEIANQSSGAHFSPLSCLDPFFEQNLVKFYQSSFTPESVRRLMKQLPPLINSGESEPSNVTHFALLRARFGTVARVETVKSLLKLSSITDFSDLTPIKPLIPIWDKVAENHKDKLEEVLTMIIDAVPSLTDSKALTAACIAIWRVFLAESKQTAAFLLSHLRVATDPDLSFENLQPTTKELVVTAVMSFIFSMESVSQRFVLCWLGCIQYIIVWAIFLRFNPLYEHHQLPPLITSVMHAAVPDSSLPHFVLAPSECVSRAVYLPFRHTTDFTTAQMESCVNTLRQFSKITAELFLDCVASKAISLATFSSDFWNLFSNFFQPRHSDSFLNTFVTKAQQLQLDFVVNMLPILTGVVKQNANPAHIGGFLAVIISILSHSSCNLPFLATINRYLPFFVDEISKSEHKAEIASALDKIMSEQGGEDTICQCVLTIMQHAEEMSRAHVVTALLCLKEIYRVLQMSGSSHETVSIVLYCLDALRRLESRTLEPMLALSVTNLQAPSSYEDLVKILEQNWNNKTITYLISFLTTFIGRTNIVDTKFRLRIFKLVEMLTDNWRKLDRVSHINRMELAISTVMLGADSDTCNELIGIYKSVLALMPPDVHFLSMAREIAPMKVQQIRNNVTRRGPANSSMPSFLPDNAIKPLEEVCDIIKTKFM